MNNFRVVRVLILGLAVLAGLALVGLLSLHLYGAHRLSRALQRFEREGGGQLFVGALVLPKIPVEKNAVTWQRPGVLAVVLFPGDLPIVGSLSTKGYTDWSREEISRLESVLVRNEPAIELLTRSSGMKVSNWDIPYQEGTTAKIPNLQAAMNAGKLIAARGRLALGRGERESVLSSVETLGALARSHEREPATIMLLIGLAIERLQLGLVHELVASGATTREEFDRLDAALCDEDLTRAVHRTNRGSAAAIVHDVRGTSDSVLGSLHATLHRSLRRALANLVAGVALEAHEVADKKVGRPVKTPLPDARDDERGKGWWQRLHEIYAPNAESVSARAMMTGSARDLAKLAIALRRAALADGLYPARLPAVDGVPVNDPLTGEPQVYEVRPDGSAELRSTTSAEIVRSISTLQLPVEALYRFTLPAPR